MDCSSQNLMQLDTLLQGYFNEKIYKTTLKAFQTNHQGISREKLPVLSHQAVCEMNPSGAGYSRQDGDESLLLSRFFPQVCVKNNDMYFTFVVTLLRINVIEIFKLTFVCFTVLQPVVNVKISRAVKLNCFTPKSLTRAKLRNSI